MPKSLLSAQELEEFLGKKYFYRQSIYRLAEDKRISSYLVNSSLYFSSEEVVLAALNRLAHRIRIRFPWLNPTFLRVNFEEEKDKKIKIYGFKDNSIVTADAENETEEDLLRKIERKGREVINMPDIPVGPNRPPDVPPPPPHHPPHHGHDRAPHEEVLEALRRIEERLSRIEERLG